MAEIRWIQAKFQVNFAYSFTGQFQNKITVPLVTVSKRTVTPEQAKHVEVLYAHLAELNVINGESCVIIWHGYISPHSLLVTLG